MADPCDLDEVRHLADLLDQAGKPGWNTIRALAAEVERLRDGLAHAEAKAKAARADADNLAKRCDRMDGIAEIAKGLPVHGEANTVYQRHPSPAAYGVHPAAAWCLDCLHPWPCPTERIRLLIEDADRG